MAIDPLEAAIRSLLAQTSTTLEPHLSQLRAALGRDVDAGDFALGMLVAALVVNHVDAVQVARAYGPLVREFQDECRRVSK